MTTTAERWHFMLGLQGSQAAQLSWLACHVGHLYDRLDALKNDVAILKAARTRAKKRPKGGKRP